MEQGGKKRREDEPEERERERGEVAFVISLSSPSVTAQLGEERERQGGRRP